MKVLVVGQGAVAEATVTSLLAAGHEVRLGSPGAEAAVRRWPRGVEAWTTDLAPPRHVEGAAEGCEVVLQLGAVRESWSSAGGAERIDVRGTRRWVAEAQRAAAGRFVLLSSLRHQRSAAPEGRAMAQAEDVARTFRRAWSIVRAGIVYAPAEGALAALSTMVRTLPAIPVPDGGRRELQPLWYEDLGRALARAVEAPEAVDCILHVAGPEVVSLEDVIDRLCVLHGRRPARVPIPSLLATMGAEAASILGLRVPARAAALAELDGATTLPASIENALTTVLGVPPTMVEEGLRKLVADVPEQMADAADGAMWSRRFWIDIDGSSRTARELRDEFRRQASHVLQLEDGPPPGRMIKLGTLLSAPVPLRGLVTLRVAEVSRDAVTALTIDGDPRAGLVTFRFLEQGRSVRVEIAVEAAATNVVDEVLDSTVGSVLEDLDWPAALERILLLSGGRAPAGVQRDERTLEEEEAERVRQRADRLRLARQRSQATATPARRARAAKRPAPPSRARRPSARVPQPRRGARRRPRS